MRKKVIEINHISYIYEENNQKALDDISLEVYEGEWLSIVGHNGSGKSTLAKILNGLYYPKDGSITISGLSLEEKNIWDIRKSLGMVFQNPDNQFVGSTVEDDVAFGLENNGVAYEEMQTLVKESLESVEMYSFLNQEPHHLSGGQKQRVAIAGVLALQPSIIILDEATAMLDPQGKKEILQLIRTLNKDKNLTIISITHDLEETLKADRVVVMNKGKIFKIGTPKEIFDLNEKLIEIGLDLPFEIKMKQALKEAGVKNPENYFLESELPN